MSRSNGTYTAPTSGWKPAVEGSVIDSSDWNALVDDLEAAVTETVYTGGLGATDNALVRTDGTDTKKAQGATPTISDTGAIAGVAAFLLTSYTIGTLPAGAEGQIAYASDWDKNGGASTGSLVFFDGEAWRGVDTGSTSGVAAPYNTVLPVISGTTREGETLSTTNGTWLQSPTSYIYQWKRDGVNIASATASTYVLTASDVGTNITVAVTATNEVGGTTATSAAVGPITSADASWSSVVLLLGLDGSDAATTTTDESPTTPHTITFNGNAQLDTAQSKFGTASVLLDGTGDYLSAPNNADWEFGNGAFTIECWVRKNGGTTGTFLSCWGGSNATRSWTLNWTTFGLEFFYIHGPSTTQRTAQYTGWAPQANTWHHVVVDRAAGGTIRVYADGVKGGDYAETDAINSGGGDLNIGQTTSTGIEFNGWIDEVRITKGVARYNSEAGYTVPTAAFPRG
jgi:hypothetical protein